VFGEPFAAGRPATDETVFEFASRRIGRRAAEVLVDAMVTGVFAGDSRRLSLAATFPRMAAMEAEHGSLTRALIARLRELRRTGRRSGGPAGPGGTLTSFRHGMNALPEALSTRLGDRLHLGAAVDELRGNANRFELGCGDREISADAVLLATPAELSARLLGERAPTAVAPLLAMQTAPIAVVMTSYDDPMAFGRRLDGFGFLVPGSERPAILGSLFCHSIFEGQAPEDTVFLRTMIGGARDPAAVELDDEALLARTRAGLEAVFGSDPEPQRLWIVRWSEGISQYAVGHLDRVAAAEAAARSAGIELAGSPYRGVSVNDCIKQARAAARRIAERVGGRDTEKHRRNG
jgi:oxygen-dependent protoporphyrinogen oxidase